MDDALRYDEQQTLTLTSCDLVCLVELNELKYFVRPPMNYIHFCCAFRLNLLSQPNQRKNSLSLSLSRILCEPCFVSSLGRCDSVRICLLFFLLCALLVIIFIQHIILMFVNLLPLLLPSELLQLLLLELLLFLLRTVAGVAAAVVDDACLQILIIVFFPIQNKFNWNIHLDLPFSQLLFVYFRSCVKVRQ